jgi:hypothetical protein
MTGTGWVTAEGRTPEPFTADVLGVLPSALGPGRDVVVVRVSGPSIQRAGGAWYGMSGAPVYVGEKLLGAVSFQLSFGPSSVVGLTAAEDMAPILSYPTASADGSAPPRASTRRIPLPASTRETVAESTETSPSDVGSLVQLRLPLSVSGVSARAMRRVTRAIRREDAPFLAYSGASGAPRPPGPSVPVSRSPASSRTATSRSPPPGRRRSSAPGRPWRSGTRCSGRGERASARTRPTSSPSSRIRFSAHTLSRTSPRA